ncbi:MAG TPA: prepilin-type N-terminal cleavage/methylation domain-containing protein [Planctomycetota bacterium]|nr:prepilin-type N-terminal cleavage/methylation domain-containing protein [Planctomycetota bacterium]
MRRQGFTLLEVMVATSVFVVLALAFFLFVQKDMDAQGVSQTKSDQATQMANALKTVVSELRQAESQSTNANYPTFSTYTVAGSQTGLNSLKALGGQGATGVAQQQAPPLFLTFNPTALTGTPTSFGTVHYKKPAYTAAAFSNFQTPILSAAGLMTWAAPVYQFVVQQGHDRVLELHHTVTGGTFPDGTSDHLLLRHVAWAYFEDSTSAQAATAPAIQPGQIRVSLWSVTIDRTNTAQSFFTQTLVTMRNK